ncbi:MAG TPA: copper resistance CopC family protein, partial [Acidimicrobiia bacterium]|nr:copper resistance CopC family protein [Acidimicrobiia bacterium]
MSRRSHLRWLFAALLALGAVLLGAAPASAHAQITSTEPVGGTTLASPPPRIVLRFGEAVEYTPSSIRVFASPSGKQIETGSVGHIDGQSTAVGVKLDKLEKGSYIVTWRVTSADSHPVHGAFTFVVGSAKGGAADAALVQKLLSSSGGDTTVGAVYAVIRFVAFGALVLLVGGFAFVALLWPAGAAQAGARRLLWGSWAAAAAVTVIGIPIEGVYAQGLPMSKALSSTVLSNVLDERFGKVWGLRLVLLALMAGILVLWRRAGAEGAGGRVPPAVAGAGGLVSLGLLLTPGLAGHAST